MKINKWTVGLAAAGLVSLASVVSADEAPKENVLTAVSGTTIGGYVSTSAIWKFGSGNGLVGRSYDGTAKQDGFNLDVVNLNISKALSDEEWSAGYTAELLAGPDASAIGTSSTGVNTSNFNIKQAYVALRAPVGNGLTFKLGVWDTLIGYEVFNAGENPNYSRSYGYSLEQTTYTGLQASYKVADWLSVTAAAADGGLGVGLGVPTINNRLATAPGGANGTYETRKDFMAAANLTAPDGWGFLSGSSLSAGIVKTAGSASAPGGFGTDPVNYYVGGAMKTPVDGLTLGASYDYLGRSVDKGLVAGVSPAFHASAVSLYSSYKATEKLKFNARAEYATSGGGAGGLWFTAPATSSNNDNELLALTGTIDYSLWANVISRVEVRWDHALDGNKPFGNTTVVGGPAAVGGNRNALSIAMNIIYKF